MTQNRFKKSPRKAHGLNRITDYFEFGYYTNDNSIRWRYPHEVIHLNQKELVPSIRYYELIPAGLNGFGAGGGAYTDLMRMFAYHLPELSWQGLGRGIGKHHPYKNTELFYTEVRLKLPSNCTKPEMYCKIFELARDNTQGRGYQVLSLAEVPNISVNNF